MKRCIALLFFGMAMMSGFAQSFEGLIIYTNTYISKNPNISDFQLGELLGTEQQYYFKPGMYRSEMNGSILSWQVYQSKEDKVYFKMPRNAIVYWKDARSNANKILQVEHHKAVTKILDYVCDELVFTTEKGTYKFYFNAELAVDPALFVRHQYDNWYEYLSRAKALPLKTIVETPEFTVESTAKQIKRMKLENGFFSLPKDVSFEKSPY